MWPFDRKKRERRRPEERRGTTDQSADGDVTTVLAGAALVHGVTPYPSPDSGCAISDSSSSCDSGGSGSSD